MTEEEYDKKTEIWMLSVKNYLIENIDLSKLNQNENYKKFAVSCFKIGDGDSFMDMPVGCKYDPKLLLRFKIDEFQDDTEYFSMGASFCVDMQLIYYHDKIVYSCCMSGYDDFEDNVPIPYSDSDTTLYFKNNDKMLSKITDTINNWINYLLDYDPDFSTDLDKLIKGM